MSGILLRGTALTPPSDASHKGLKFSISDCLRSHCYWSTIVICNCTFCADNGGIPPRQSNLLYTFVYPISTPYVRNIQENGGAARYRPEVRSAYYERVYVHSSRSNLVIEPVKNFCNRNYKIH